MKDPSRRQLARLPQIEKLLAEPQLARWHPRLSRPLVSRLAAQCVAEARRRMSGGESFPGLPAILRTIERRCAQTARRRIQRLINATGVMLHTNLGRAPISPAVWRSAEAVNTGYSNLELDLDSGKRGRRKGLIPELLGLLVGSQDALMVNNNAAAVFLILSAFAAGREVIVSRGEQVQIGGGFRIPEILALSGARLKEVGTTNITRLEDYTRALGADTALVLVVHSSNFRIRGFTGRPSAKELAAALPRRVLLVVDQGSGTTGEKLPGEQAVSHYLKAGAHLVSFSGDKVLGGPQAGLIAGRRTLIRALADHPLNRVFRPGKTVYSLMEEFLVARLNGQAPSPVSSVLELSEAELRRRGRCLLRGLPAEWARLVPSSVTAGGGSAPDEHFPSLSVQLGLPGRPEALLARLRSLDPPIIGTISGGRVLLNLATLLPEDLEPVRAALQELLPGAAAGASANASANASAGR